MAAYLIAILDVHDQDEMNKYIAAAATTLAPFNAKIHAIDEDADVIEGPWPGGRTVVLEFESRAAIREWYDSPDYQAAAQHRFRGATTAMVALDKWTGPGAA